VLVTLSGSRFNRLMSSVFLVLPVTIRHASSYFEIVCLKYGVLIDTCIGRKALLGLTKYKSAPFTCVGNLEFRPATIDQFLQNLELATFLIAMRASHGILLQSRPLLPWMQQREIGKSCKGNI